MSASSLQILLYQQVWQSPDLRQLDVLVIPCIGLVIVGKECAACHFIIIFHLFWESYETVAIPYVHLPIIRPSSLFHSMDLYVLTFLPRDLNVNKINK